MFVKELTGYTSLITIPHVESHVMRNTKPKVNVSIIIVSYNGQDDLGRCLLSLLAKKRPDYEIIVVDNNSSDDSIAMIEKSFPEVRLISNPQNGGFGRGNNIGTKEALGKYVVFINPDTTVENGWLEALIDALESNPKAGLATSQILLMASPYRVNACGNNTHFTGLTLCRGMGQKRNELSAMVEVGATSGCAFAMRKDLFDTLGGFDEPFFMYMEDTDLSWRARLMGYKVIYVPDSIVYHDYKLKFGSKKVFYQERNRYIMLLKSLKWRTLLLMTPALLLAEIITWGFVLVRERTNFSNKLKAYKWIVEHWTELMEKRHEVQRLRQVSDHEFLSDCITNLDYSQTGKGLIAMLADKVFNPLFSILHKFSLYFI
ncbi:MAG: hypothetical protein B6242_08800 [Anaerolineaceae bacterium 4572_78]|nr:MAG: hypothetical protein B6242_08800 [Anaerolineaceae bacterium 4572_78]